MAGVQHTTSLDDGRVTFGMKAGGQSTGFLCPAFYCTCGQLKTVPLGVSVPLEEWTLQPNAGWGLTLFTYKLRTEPCPEGGLAFAPSFQKVLSKGRIFI